MAAKQFIRPEIIFVFIRVHSWLKTFLPSGRRATKSVSIGNLYKSQASLNKRVFHNGDQEAQLPLISLFGASNEMPQGDSGTLPLWVSMVWPSVWRANRSAAQCFRQRQHEFADGRDLVVLRNELEVRSADRELS